MLLKKTTFIVAVFYLVSSLFGAEAKIEKFEPPFWYSCFENDSLMLLVYGAHLDQVNDISCSRHLKVLSWSVSAQGNFITIQCRVRHSGQASLYFRQKDGSPQISRSYDIRSASKYQPLGLNSSDIMYLIMPDRFSDGDSLNNRIPGNPDNVDKSLLWGRHGGDLQGILNHLSYLEQSGVTALWLTPVYENNYRFAYHGYTPSDLYAVDPHLGDMQLYLKLIAACHAAGIRMIQDHIVNHISPSHPIAADPPGAGWLNGSADSYHDCDYDISAVTDEWGLPEARTYTQSGWFAGYLPDMNMADPDVQRYYIQHALWWIQTASLDGIRQDTWPYSDQTGMRNWAAALRREYPGLFILGEIWVNDPVTLSWFFSDSPRLENALRSVTDFPLSTALKSLMKGQMSLRAFHDRLGQDYIFKDPNSLLIFLDNHDLGRFISEEITPDTYLNALTILYSIRGIPMLYYGDEIGLPGAADPDNRREFPGGFSQADHDAFTDVGRRDSENRIYHHILKLHSLRQDFPALFATPMTHWMAGDSVYVVERSTSVRRLLMIYNQSLKPRQGSNRLFRSRNDESFIDCLQDMNQARNAESYTIPARSARLFLSLPD